MHENERALSLAVEAYEEFVNDPYRAGLTLQAVEIRLTGSSPDISYHCQSGSKSQGGMLFFVSDLRKIHDLTHKTVL